nr:50S ribosomal protein L4 [Saprospiraceae bacterium]
MKLEVVDINGKPTGRSVELPDEIFGLEPNDHVVYLAVKAAQANMRQGTHSAKERNAVKGSTRKIKKQKGTGTARAGDIKNPLFRGGGRIFGPRPRKYTQRLNKKVRRLARNTALSGKAAEKKIVMVENFTYEQPSTRQFADMLRNLDLDQQKSLILMGDYDKNLYLSSRNIPNTKMIHLKDVNTLDILTANTLLMSENCIEYLNELV